MAEYKNFTDNVITFVRGSLAKYNEGKQNGKYLNDIYFASDQRTIFANGIAYGLTQAEEELLTTLGTTLVKAEMTKPGTFTFTDNLGSVTTLSLDIATDDLTGLMSAADHTKLSGIEEGAQVNIIEKIATDSEEIVFEGFDDAGSTFTIPAITVSHENSTKTSTINLQDTLDNFAYKGAVYTKKEVDERIKQNVTAAYKVMGSVTNKELLALSLESLEVGEVYNMSTPGSVPTKGGEGSSESTGDDVFPAGTNFVVVEFDGAKGWDALAGNFDTSVLEQRLDNDEALIDANDKAIKAEVERATLAESTLQGNIDDVWEHIGSYNDSIDGLTADNAADQSIHQRINLLYQMLGELDMEGASWEEFIIRITDQKYVAGTTLIDNVTPTLDTIKNATLAGSENGPIDTFKDVAQLIKELIAADETLAQNLAQELLDRAAADTKIREDFAAADSDLKEDLEGQLDEAKKAIDAYTVNGKKISTNPVLNGGDIEITGYSKLEAVGEQVAIAEDDTVNEAVAKLEKNIALAVAGQTTGLGEVRDRLDIIEEDLNDDAGIAAKPGQGLLEIVEGLVGNGEGSVKDQIEDAMDALKDGGDGSTWDDMVLTDDKNTTHDTTLTGLKAYVDAQDDAHLEVAKTYTDNEIAKALTWYEAD